MDVVGFINNWVIIRPSNWWLGSSTTESEQSFNRMAWVGSSTNRARTGLRMDGPARFIHNWVRTGLPMNGLSWFIHKQIRWMGVPMDGPARFIHNWVRTGLPIDGLDRSTHKLSQNRLPMDDNFGFIHRRLLVHTLIILAAHARALITRRRREHQALLAHQLI
jgi:hypothetical protein